MQGAKTPFSGDLPKQIYQNYEYFDAMTDMILLDGLRKGNIKIILVNLSSCSEGHEQREYVNRLKFLIDCFSIQPI